MKEESEACRSGSKKKKTTVLSVSPENIGIIFKLLIENGLPLHRMEDPEWEIALKI